MKNITQAEWEEKVATDTNAVILDVRTDNECKYGMIENATCLDVFDTENFISEIEKVDKTKNYYVYCMSGNRSSSACQFLEKSGIENTYNLIGGMSAWRGKTVTK